MVQWARKLYTTPINVTQGWLNNVVERYCQMGANRLSERACYFRESNSQSNFPLSKLHLPNVGELKGVQYAKRPSNAEVFDL